MDIKEFLDFYNNTFKPAYADLVSYISDKPLQILIEIENTFAHLCVYLDESKSESDRKSNLQKASNHLHRATLDCYKLIWVEMSKDIEAIIKDPNLRKFAVNMPEEEVLKKWRDFKERAKIARKMELDNIGLNKIEDVVEAYKETIETGWKIVHNIDEIKCSEFEKFSLMTFVKQQ